PNLNSKTQDLAKWDAAVSVLDQAEFRDALVKTYADGPDKAKVSMVNTRLATILTQAAAKARQAQGNDSAEARQLDDTAALLTPTSFTAARLPADAETEGAVTKKYETVVAVARSIRDEKRDARQTQAAIVADLDRWHATVKTIASATAPIAMPSRIEEGRGQTTDKDVLDVMLATLRYEHVA